MLKIDSESQKMAEEIARLESENDKLAVDFED